MNSTFPTCAFHPEAMADFCCAECKKLICEECRRDFQGKIYCRSCIATSASVSPGNGAVANRPSLGLKSATATPDVKLDRTCHFHHEVEAVDRCEVCAKPVCPTCFFRTEDMATLCPECIALPGDHPMGPLRILLFSLGLATLVLLPVCFFAASALGDMGAGIIIMGGILLGTFFRVSAIEKNLSTPWYVWTVALFNGSGVRVWGAGVVLTMLRKPCRDGLSAC